MELMFEIEETMLEADILNGLLRAVTNAAYDGSYGFDYFETAFNHICNLADEHYGHLEKLTNRTFEANKKEKIQVLHMQAERG
ncbi:MAG: hypothetical protein OSJ45_13580 [Lachnospiraceae bacterium]|nr:hypothetical protein [Lachnospiraceae bacterium]